MHALNRARYGVPFLVLLPGLAAASPVDSRHDDRAWCIEVLRVFPAA